MKIQMPKPKIAQREDHDGRKKFYCKNDFHLHDETGSSAYIGEKSSLIG